jgi:Cu2+-exporting ATPase
LPGMMTLIALAISVAFVFSIVVECGFPGIPIWEELATLVTIMLLGHWIEMRSISQASGALKELAKLLPDTAVRINGGELEQIPVSQLSDDDLILIRPGQSVPADGIVREGASAVNEAMITGESRPVKKEAGDKVIAGTVDGSGALRVEVTGTGERTALAGIMRLVQQAQTSRSRTQALADRAAFWLTIVALSVGIVTLVVWLAARSNDPAFAIERFVTVLVIACPHALGLAVPLVVAISTCGWRIPNYSDSWRFSPDHYKWTNEIRWAEKMDKRTISNRGVLYENLKPLAYEARWLVSFAITQPLMGAEI